ncbi:MAG: YcfL family protein [Desulfuromonadales bacterium]|nr:YcfL family protein [Desulfuromonadales bacterium]
MQLLKLAALLIVGMVALSGCSATSGAEGRAKVGWTDDGAPLLNTKVVYNSSNLSRKVAIEEMTSSKAGDMLLAQVTMRSKAGDTLNLQYKFEWFDLNGLALNAASATWKPLIIYGKESKTIQGLAPDPRGRDYKLLLRDAD